MTRLAVSVQRCSTSAAGVVGGCLEWRLLLHLPGQRKLQLLLLLPMLLLLPLLFSVSFYLALSRAHCMAVALKRAVSPRSLFLFFLSRTVTRSIAHLLTLSSPDSEYSKSATSFVLFADRHHGDVKSAGALIVGVFSLSAAVDHRSMA